MARKPLYLLIFILFALLQVSAQSLMSDVRPPEGERPESSKPDTSAVTGPKIGYWTKAQDNLDTFRIAIDTVLEGIHNYNPIFRESISNTFLGNLGSPYQSNIYFDRPEVDFLFSDVYDIYLKMPEELPIINTKTPFSVLSYATGGSKQYAEQTLNGIFSQNVNESLNIGVYFDILYAIGRYSNSSTRDKNFGAFSSFMRPRYNAFFSIGTTRAENYENGGFGTSTEWMDEYINDPNAGTITTPISDQPENYPVRLSSARSFLETSFISFNHKYNLGKLMPVENADSTSEEFVSAVNIVHDFQFDVNVKQYEDSYTADTYYDTAYIHGSNTLDSLRSRKFSNRLGIYLDEGINNFAKFGLGGYLQMDNVFLTNTPWVGSIEDSTLSKGYSEMIADDSNINMDSTRHAFINQYDGYKYTNVIVGGSIFKRRGTHFFFDASGQICLAGYNSGDWDLSGELRQAFPRMGDWELSARAKLKRYKPDYIKQHYYSNNFWWDNDFDAMTKQSLGGSLKIPSINFEASIDVDNIQDHVYYNEFAMPTQYDKNLAILAVNIKKTFEIGRHLVWENDVEYQETSASEVMPLPKFSFYSNLYFKNVLFDVLHFHIGADCRYNTSYYAPGYMPATGRFYNQRDVEIGSYPMMNVYADFFLRRMRFYVMGTHINYGWPSLEYFSAPHYAYNQRMFKFGLQWTFYD